MVEIESLFVSLLYTKFHKSKVSRISQFLSSCICCKFEFEYKLLFILPFICISYIPYPSMELDKILCDSVTRIEIPSLLDRSIEIEFE